MESFLDPDDVASLKEDVGDAWETQRAIQEGGHDIVFAFTNPETQEREYTDSQTVTVQYPAGEPKRIADQTGEEVEVNIILKHPDPFDCQRGYTFGFGPDGHEQRGEVLAVYEAKLGIVRAMAHLTV